MDWSALGRKVAPYAPLLGTALAGPMGATAGAWLAQALGVRGDPQTIAAGLDATDGLPDYLARWEADHQTELRQMTLAAETERLRAVNETMRVEAASQHGYVRNWRPTWGYVTAGAWAVQTLAIFACVLGAVAATLSGKADAVTALLDGAAGLVGALTVQWSVALAVLGINVRARSDDKQVAAGQTPRGLLGNLAALTGRARS